MLMTYQNMIRSIENYILHIAILHHEDYNVNNELYLKYKNICVCSVKGYQSCADRMTVYLRL